MPESTPTLPSRAVFLSYASQDADAARRLCDALRAAGVEVWFDQNELVGGDAWDAKIRGQIASCALFVPLISANTQARLEGYFRIEWKIAARRTHAMATAKTFLLPIVIDDTHDADAHVPEEFREVQWTRLPGGETPARFTDRVKKLLAGEASAPRHDSVPPLSASVPASRPARRWLAPVLGGVGIAVVALLVAKPWQKAGPAAAAPIAAPDASNPKVAALLAQVQPLLSKTDVVRAELDTAVTLLEQAATLDPSDPEVWAARALIDCRYAEEWIDHSPARLDQARRHATQAIGLGPRSPTARLAQAKSMVSLNNDSATKMAAVAVLEPLVAEPGDRSDALILLAVLEWDLGHREQASAYLDRAAQNPAKVARVHYARAIRALWIGQADRSEEEIKRALAVEPAALFQLWKSYLLTIWRGDSAGAVEALKPLPAAMLVEDFPAAARYFTFLMARDYEGAVAALRAVPRDFIESQALTGPTGYYLGYAFARQGKAEAAAIEWRGALELVERRLAARPNERRLLNFKALLLESLGNRPEALKVRRTLRELYGPSTETWEEYWREVQLLSDDEAIDYLGTLAKDVRVMTLAGSLRTDPYLDRLRGNPRFTALLAQIDADPRLSPRAKREPAAPAPAGGQKSEGG